jgi:Programmed cell death protein 2, C-terminal putative domain
VVAGLLRAAASSVHLALPRGHWQAVALHQSQVDLYVSGVSVCWRSVGGRPLWPTLGPPAAAAGCTRCGAERRFEMQLMAPLIYNIQEAAAWALEELQSSGGAAGGELGAAVAGILDALDRWEWATVGVFTCSRSCAAEWAEEVLVVQNE